MGLFDKFSMPKSQNEYKPKQYKLNSPKTSPIMGEASTFKTLASFDLEVGAPRFSGDIPYARINSYEDFK